TNHLDMFEPKADKKIKSIKPEFKIPLKLGLYVLKDKKGHVKIDLPVKGSIDNPDFSYRKIVMKALGNVLLKVITAPFSFLSGNSDNLEYIAIEPLQWEFTAEQYTKFDKLADMLRDKPDMKVTLTQRLDYRQALQAQAENNLKMAYYNHLRQADTTVAYTPLTMLEYEKIRDLKLKSDEVTLFADSLLRAQGNDPSKFNTAKKAQMLYGTRAAEQLMTMFERRNTAVSTYMTSMQGIPATALRVVTMPAEELHAYTGKNRYTLGLEVEGETAEVSENADDVAAQQQAMGLAPAEATSHATSHAKNSDSGK
ncbi:MAG: AsmA family protein, partial [Alistipes sp.]